MEAFGIASIIHGFNFNDICDIFKAFSFSNSGVCFSA